MEVAVFSKIKAFFSWLFDWGSAKPKEPAVVMMKDTGLAERIKAEQDRMRDAVFILKPHPLSPRPTIGPHGHAEPAKTRAAHVPERDLWRGSGSIYAAGPSSQSIYAAGRPSEPVVIRHTTVVHDDGPGLGTGILIGAALASMSESRAAAARREDAPEPARTRDPDPEPTRSAPEPERSSSPVTYDSGPSYDSSPSSSPSSE